jgi:type I restriction enzyme S subunit
MSNPSVNPWTGKIPDSWECIRLKYLADYNNYYPIGDGDHGSIVPAMYKFAEEDGYVPYIRVQNLSFEGNICLDDVVYISNKVNCDNYKSKLVPNDILIAKTGATVGKLGIVPTNIPSANTTSSVGKITLSTMYNRDFIFYTLMADHEQTKLKQIAFQKSAQPGFNIDDIRDLPIALPDYKTQCEIGAFLRDKVTKIDSLISELNTQVDLLEEYKGMFVTDLISSSEYESILTPLKFMGRFFGGLTYSPDDIVDNNEGTLVLRSSNIQNWKLCFDDCVYVSSRLAKNRPAKVNDILICSRNGSASLIGKCAIVDSDNYSFGAFMMICRSPKYYEYLYYFLMSANFRSYLSHTLSVTVNQITSRTISEVKVPKFSDNDTKEICFKIKEEFSRIDKLIDIKKEKIKLIQEFRKSFIYEKVTGKDKM